MESHTVRNMELPWVQVWPPPFAILYMAYLEAEFWRNEPLKPEIYLRYIDDNLFTWPHGQGDLNRAFERLNTQKVRIKYTITTSDSEINFLDIPLYKGNRFRSSGILDIKPFFKQTNQMTIELSALFFIPPPVRLQGYCSR